MLNSDELKSLMANYYGTEAYHAYAIIPTFKILLTDGAKAFADNADAYWFIGDFYSYIPTIRKKRPENYMFTVKLVVKADETAQLIIKDDDDEVILIKDYTYTDCPEGEWTFFYYAEDKVLLWCGEY